MQFKFFMGLLVIGNIFQAEGQKFSKIFLNLYTDSLKKGTYNYINVDGLMSDGKYMPLDTSEIRFWASDGTFSGNSLFIPHDFNKEKVDIKISSKSQPAITKEFTMYVRKKPDEVLKTSEQLLDEMKGRKGKKKVKAKSNI